MITPRASNPGDSFQHRDETSTEERHGHEQHERERNFAGHDARRMRSSRGADVAPRRNASTRFARAASTRNEPAQCAGREGNDRQDGNHTPTDPDVAARAKSPNCCNARRPPRQASPRRAPRARRRRCPASPALQLPAAVAAQSRRGRAKRRSHRRSRRRSIDRTMSNPARFVNASASASAASPARTVSGRLATPDRCRHRSHLDTRRRHDSRLSIVERCGEGVGRGTGRQPPVTPTRCPPRMACAGDVGDGSKNPGRRWTGIAVT